jgi:hypothetical protein
VRKGKAAMKVYASLSEVERGAIDAALDKLKDDVLENSGFSLMNDSRKERAAEALAIYIKESREGE